MSVTSRQSRTEKVETAVDLDALTFDDVTDQPRPELADPAVVARVAAIREEMAQEDRLYAMNLAMLRKAISLTQTELAERLGIGQSAVVRTEKAEDMLVSTLRKYLEGVGAHLSLVVHTADGHVVELDLSAIPEQQRHLA